LKLLLKLLKSSDIQAQVTTMAEHLSLRDDTVDGHGEEEEEGEESVVDLANDDQDDDEMSGISDEHQVSSSTSIAYEHEQATSSTSIAPPHAGGNNPPGKKTGTAKNASTNKALKNLASFGDFKFQSSTVSTRSNITTPVAQSNSAVSGVSKVAEPKKKAVKKVVKGSKKAPVGSKVKPSATGQKKGKACSSNESVASCVVSAKKTTSRSRNNVVQQEAPLN
jgi:hypothetical protein